MARIEEQMNFNDIEIWNINVSGMMRGTQHSFHAHGVQFRILKHIGYPLPANETCWKDTVLVYPEENV